MLLAVQIQAILYHFIMGWVYALGFSCLITFMKSFRTAFFKGCMEIVYHVLFTSLIFYGLYCINGGVTNLYLIVIFLSGVIIYYAFYLSVFLDFFVSFKKFLRPFRKNIRVVKKKILAIIKVPKTMLRRRKANVEKRKRAKEEHKAEKKKTSTKNIL